jgi:hypothetical protein
MDLDVHHIVVSCSADNKLSTILLRGPHPSLLLPHPIIPCPTSEAPSRIQQLISLIVILLTAVLMILIFMKFKQNQEVVVG